MPYVSSPILGLSLWLVTSGQFPKGYLYFFLVFFLLWEGLALILVPAKFASLSGMERWGTEFVLPLPC